MKALIAFLEKYFVPVASKVGSQRHLVAVRDGFAAIMPIIIAGSMGVLINNLQVTKDAATDPYQMLMNSIFGGTGWKSFGGNIWWGTFAIMSLFIVFTVAYNLAKSYNLNPMSVGVLSFSTYFVFVPQAVNATLGDKVGDLAVPAELVGQQVGAWGNINWGFTNSGALFAAILVAIVVTELFRLLSKSKALIITMPEGVPPAVAKAFAALLPSLIVLSLAALAQMFLFNKEALVMLINNSVQKPIVAIGTSFGGALAIAFLNHFLWFFGLHGSNILEPVMQAINLTAIDANIAAVTAGQPAPFIVTKSFFDAFVYMGGSGTTIALLAAIYVGSKRKHYRMMANLGVGPGLFNINEPVIFGLPIVLNPIYFIPFILTPMVLTTVAYVATAVGIVPHTIAVIPWVMPPILGGFLATGGSVMGGALAAVNLVIAFVIYMPFVLLAEKHEADNL
jgi:PTS system cellobiose-specific IIC component